MGLSADHEHQDYGRRDEILSRCILLREFLASDTWNPDWYENLDWITDYLESQIKESYGDWRLAGVVNFGTHIASHRAFGELAPATRESLFTTFVLCGYELGDGLDALFFSEEIADRLGYVGLIDARDENALGTAKAAIGGLLNAGVFLKEQTSPFGKFIKNLDLSGLGE